jgi:hypothetical protein
VPNESVHAAVSVCAWASLFVQDECRSDVMRVCQLGGEVDERAGTTP